MEKITIGDTWSRRFIEIVFADVLRSRARCGELDTCSYRSLMMMSAVSIAVIAFLTFWVSYGIAYSIALPIYVAFTADMWITDAVGFLLTSLSAESPSEGGWGLIIWFVWLLLGVALFLSIANIEKFVLVDYQREHLSKWGRYMLASATVFLATGVLVSIVYATIYIFVFIMSLFLVIFCIEYLLRARKEYVKTHYTAEERSKPTVAAELYQSWKEKYCKKIELK